MPFEPPLVTIVTPCLNAARTIATTLESVRVQEHSSIEHLVIDGGSTDATFEVIRSFEPTATLVVVPGINQSEALNTGFRRARGSIIGWLNADDYYFDRRVVSRAVEELRRHPDVGAVYGDVVFVNEVGDMVTARCSPSFSANRLRRYSFIAQPTVFVRREIVLSHPIDGRLEFVMDAEWLLRLAVSTRFRKVNAFQAAFRLHPHSKVHQFGVGAYCDEERHLRREHRTRSLLARGCYRALDWMSNAVGAGFGHYRFRCLPAERSAEFRSMSRPTSPGIS